MQLYSGTVVLRCVPVLTSLHPFEMSKASVRSSMFSSVFLFVWSNGILINRHSTRVVQYSL